MRFALSIGAGIGLAGLAFAHGDVTPQAIDTSALPEVGEEWLIENPYRADAEVFAKAIEIGASGYNSNCARCHGLGAISGGLAPDLRFLEAEEYGDEWYMERYIHGYTQNGITKMPAFGDLLGQEAAWAIRSYVETRPDDAVVEEFADELKGIRDALAAMDAGADASAERERLAAIAADIPTLSGSPYSDSVAQQAAMRIEGGDIAGAVEALSVGLSAAR